MWIVTLTKQPTQNLWKPEYFPHRFKYKDEAETCRNDVIQAGGDAAITKEKAKKPNTLNTPQSLPTMGRFEKGKTYLVEPGDHFNLLLPDGTLLNVEQTADDFDITKTDGVVAYRKATSTVAKQIDEDEETVSGRN